MNDHALIKKCQNGDRKAFEALLNQYYDTIYRFAFRWCADQHNAQDITQQVCIKLAHSIQQFEFKSSFSSWLYRIVINCAKDYYKSPKQFNQREEHSDNIEQQTNLNAEDNSEKRFYSQQILEHINTLEDSLKDTLVMVYGQGLSHKQAADKLNVKESTVSWRIHEARKLLKQTFSTSTLQTTSANNDYVRGSA